MIGEIKAVYGFYFAFPDFYPGIFLSRWSMGGRDMVKNQSFLQFKRANCKNCYKCVRNCPVKAIRVKEQQAMIMEKQCILCEKCTLVCPQNAKEELNQIPDLQKRMLHGEKFAASVHPAFFAQYAGLDFEDISFMLKQLGFTEVYDAAEGGAVMKKMYEELLKGKTDSEVVISSQCMVVTLLVERKYPELLTKMARIPSMMQIHAQMIKQRDPEMHVVFISPCISAMAEMNEEGNSVDYVITFSEIEQWLEYKNCRRPVGKPEKDIRLSRVLALGGGLSMAMKSVEPYQPIFVNGIGNCKSVLEELKSGHYNNCFLDLSACINGCIGGPSFRKKPIHLLDALFAVKHVSMPEAGVPDFTLDYPAEYHPEIRQFMTTIEKEEQVSEGQIRTVLEQMGKFEKKDELNCGACGYNTCRDKAIAIAQGKAEISMCVPFMRTKQENYSQKIIDAMPGLLVTVDYHLNIVHMNKTALDLFDINRKKNLIGSPVSAIMDDYSLVNMIAFEKKLSQDQVTLADGKTCLDRVITNDKSNQMLLCIMKDITKDIENRKKRVKSQIAAAEMADKLMEEQLRMVHEIAGLLGETAADTKVAVERLKNTIMQEDLS